MKNLSERKEILQRHETGDLMQVPQVCFLFNDTRWRLGRILPLKVIANSRSHREMYVVVCSHRILVGRL